MQAVSRFFSWWGLRYLWFLIPPTTLRLLALRQRSAELTTYDALGFVADAGLCLMLIPTCAWFVARVAPRSQRCWWLLGWCFWVTLYQANLEHILANDAAASFEYLAYLFDRQFLVGSATVVSYPYVLLTLLGLGLVLLLSPPHPPRFTTGLSLSLGGLALLMASVIAAGSPPFVQGWRYQNLLQSNGQWLLARIMSPAEPLAGAAAAGDDLLRADLSGPKFLPETSAKTNVLLVVLEGVSGFHLKQVGAFHGINSSEVMPHLSAWGRRGLTFGNFLNHQRQTNRGLYALLCGNYPKLDSSTAKMTEFLSAKGGRCLPQVLRDQGYRTAYLQAAGLVFMLKNAFMEKAGFSIVKGDSDFVKPLARGRWGVDDKTLLRAARQWIGQQSPQQPWFLTLLTVGTHHPYIVPRSHGHASRTAAFRYADEAIAELLAGLAHDGVLANTLVLITSDESVGLARDADAYAQAMSQQWGFLVALVPPVTGSDSPASQVSPPSPDLAVAATPQPALVTSLFGQRDIALSVLDYLGLGHQAATAFGGRSVWRHYSQPRQLLFGNTYLKHAGAVREGLDVTLCDPAMIRCARRAVTDGRYFGRRSAKVLDVPEKVAAAEAELSQLALAVAQQNKSLIEPSAAGQAEFDFSFRQPLLVNARSDTIANGQYFGLPAHHRVHIKMVLASRGPSSIQVVHRLTADSARRWLVRPVVARLDPQQRLILEYDFVTDRAYDRCELTLLAQGRGPKDWQASVTLLAAQVTIAAVAGGHQEPAVGLPLVLGPQSIIIEGLGH